MYCITRSFKTIWGYSFWHLILFNIPPSKISYLRKIKKKYSYCLYSYLIVFGEGGRFIFKNNLVHQKIMSMFIILPKIPKVFLVLFYFLVKYLRTNIRHHNYKLYFISLKTCVSFNI